jgi:ATP-dependent Clp protease ATP-binding subunit ClpC
MDSDFIGTEHVLLAILKQEGTGASEILAILKVEPGRVRAEVNGLVSYPCASHAHADPEMLQFSPMCRRAIASAREFSLKLGETQVEPEHILLAIMHENQSTAAEALSRLGIGIDDVGRLAVARKKHGQSPPPATGM